MKIAVVGAGYVGLANAVLLAKHNQVYIVDILADKVNKINSKLVVVVKVEIINNSLNHNNKVIQVVEVHKNKKNNHKNRIVVNLGKIHKKKMNQNKMLDMIHMNYGSRQ